jgi:hypothetical protein
MEPHIYHKWRYNEGRVLPMNNLDKMSPGELQALRQKILNCTMEFMMKNVKKQPLPSSREIAEYVASKLEIPVELVESIKIGMDQELAEELKQSLM